MRPTVIFLHGSGDTGRGVEGWLRSLAPPEALAPFDWEFPTAEPIPYAGAKSERRYHRVAASSRTTPNRPNLLSVRLESALIDAAVKRGRVGARRSPVGRFSMVGI